MFKPGLRYTECCHVKQELTLKLRSRSKEYFVPNDITLVILLC